jgi:hypothetical protein
VLFFGTLARTPVAAVLDPPIAASWGNVGYMGGRSVSPPSATPTCRPPMLSS